LVVLEVNTLPGMTPTSLVPDAAKAVGMGYAEVVRWMIEDGLKQRGARN
jgi:D-alanine-D-alanine ligase